MTGLLALRNDMKDVNYKHKTRCQWQQSYIFRSSEYKEITDLRTLGWPIQINWTFWNILTSRIINTGTYVWFLIYNWPPRAAQGQPKGRKWPLGRTLPRSALSIPLSKSFSVYLSLPLSLFKSFSIHPLLSRSLSIFLFLCHCSHPQVISEEERLSYELRYLGVRHAWHWRLEAERRLFI